MANPLRFIAFQVVASTTDGKPVYSMADIIDPLPRHTSSLLRGARMTAGSRGYVLVGRASDDWKAFEAGARRIAGMDQPRRKEATT